MGLRNNKGGPAFSTRSTGLKKKGATPKFPIVVSVTPPMARHKSMPGAISTGIRSVPVIQVDVKVGLRYGRFKLGYSPVNKTVYTAAYSGIISGLTGSSRVLLDTDEADYSGFATIAGAFAQSFDIAWAINPDTNPPNTLQVFIIEKTCKAVWENRFTEVSAETTSPSSFTQMCNAIIALVVASDDYFASQSITPDPWPGGGGGGGTVTSVTAGTGITITGSPTVDPTVVNDGVLDVTAGTGVTITGSAQHPIVNASGALTSFGADLVDSNATDQWIASISGDGGGGGTVPIHVTTFDFDSTQSNPTFEQDSTTAPHAAPMDDIVQSSSDTNASPGDRRVVLGVASGTGAQPMFRICYGGRSIPIMTAGPSQGLGGLATNLWMFYANSGLIPDDANYTIQQNFLGGLSFNTQGGNFSFVVANATTVATFASNGDWIMEGVTIGEAVKVFLLANATTIPLQNEPPAGGGAFYGVAGQVYYNDSFGTKTALSPTPSGTVNTQDASHYLYEQFGRVAASAGTLILDVPMLGQGGGNPISGRLRVTAIAKIATAGTGTTAGDTYIQEDIVSFNQAGGVVSQIGATSHQNGATGQASASLATSTVTYGNSGTNATVTLTVNATTGTLGNADCEIYVDQLLN